MGIYGANFGLNFDITPDTTDPTIAIVLPVDTATVSPNFTVSGVAADDIQVSLVEVQIDAEAFVTATGTTTWSHIITDLAEGPHTITARVTDSSSNTATDSITVTSDPTLLGGGSGGGVKKHIGVSLVDKQKKALLPPTRPVIQISGRSESKILLPIVSHSLSQLAISVRARSESVVKPIKIQAASHGSIVRKMLFTSKGSIKRIFLGESIGVLNQSVGIGKIIKSHGILNERIEKMARLMQIQTILAAMKED